MIVFIKLKKKEICFRRSDCLRLRNKDLVPNMNLSSLLNAHVHPKERGRPKHFFLLRVLAEAIYQRKGCSLCYRGSYFMINFSKRFWGVCAKKRGYYLILSFRFKCMTFVHRYLRRVFKGSPPRCLSPTAGSTSS